MSRPRVRDKAASRRARTLAALLVAVVVAGCTGDDGGSSPAESLDRGTGPLDLKSVCPGKVVVQSAWVPEAEHGALYHLLGDDPVVDVDRKRVTGRLVSQGRDTGVSLEIRAGGPAIGFQNAGTLMYSDSQITLAQVATDDAIGLSARQPVVAVAAPFDIAPYMIMWDPKTYPQFRSVVDIGQTNTTVLYFKGATYMDYLVGSGILRRSQVDGSYQGSPERFVASGGKVAQQGFATNEPFVYEKALPQWRRPVQFQLIHDTGYPIYPEAIVVRAGRKDALAPCLRKLVPLIQRAQVEYVKDPAATNDLIVRLVDEYKVGFGYSREQARFSVEQQLKLGMVGNGGNDTLGDFDRRRIERVVDIVVPIYKGQRREVKDRLGPDDLYTNEFIDPSIKLSP